MTSEDILSHPTRVLTREQRHSYFADGFVAVDGLVPQDWVQRLTARMAHLDPRPCLVPPNWAEQRYGSIFTAQQGE